MKSQIETIPVLDFNTLLNLSAHQVSKLTDILKFHLIFHKIITGKGLEFDRLREYIPGDDAKLIDWNSFARTTRLFVKVFKEERLLDSIFLVDVSNTMLFGTTEYAKNEYASIITSTLAMAANLIGDKNGLICFSNEIKVVIEPKMGIESVLEIIKTLSNRKTYGGLKSWNSFSSVVMENLSPESYIFLISDFIGANEDLYDFISKASAYFKAITLIMVRDPLDSFIPKDIGYIYLSDPETGEVSLVNADKIREEYNKLAQKEEKEVEQKAQQQGAYFLKIHTNKDFVDEMAKFLMKRMKEWR